MPGYPIEVTAQDLYENSTTQKHEIGTRGIFKTDNGLVEAVYVRNASSATLVRGFAVHHGATPWNVNTTHYGNTNATMGTLGLVGVLCQSLPGSATAAFAWAACRGPITALNVAATVASGNHNGVLYGINAGTGNLVSLVSTLATGNAEITRGMILGLGGGATSTIATSGGAGPAYVNLAWR